MADEDESDESNESDESPDPSVAKWHCLISSPNHRPRIRVVGSARFEDEATAAADQLVQWLNEGRRHVGAGRA